MCGITGIWHTDGSCVDAQHLRRATDLLVHRGPDDEGFLRLRSATAHWSENMEESFEADLGFGFRRLAILDLSPAGHQPMSYADGSYWIVFNGEIYNYLELRAELQALGHSFHSGSDTEVVLAAYDQWGTACLERFNGMWAFALWDARRHSLFCARDRFGIKPFYYSWQNGAFVFASEIKAVLSLQECLPEANDAMVYDFLTWGWTDHTQETFFSNICQLLPGHLIIVKDGRLSTQGYWSLDPDLRADLPTDTAYADRFLALFEDAVRIHLRSDVPVGTCLSGGLDSSSIVCVANRLLMDEHALPADLVGERQKTFSSCFDDARFDERPYIDEVLAVTGAESNQVFPSGERLIDVLSKIVWHQDEPFGSTSLFAQWSVMERVAERGVRVLLDGQGADEALGGYHHYFHYYWGTLLNQGQWISLAQEIRAYRKKYPVPFVQLLLGVAKNYVPHSMVNWARRFRRAGVNLGPIALFSDFAAQHTRRFYTPSPWRGNLIDDYLHDSLTTYSLPALLRYEDRNSMAHSIEARVPFLDHRLVEFVASVPHSQKIHDATTKVILRNAMQGILPEKVRLRADKMGFVTPEKVWLKAELGVLLRDVARSRTFIERGYLDSRQVLRMLDQHQVDRRDITFVASRWLSLELWFRQFIDGARPGAV